MTTQLFDAMAKQAITKVVIQFSGGNDEGGADDATAYYADGSEKDLLSRVYLDHRTQTHVVGYYEDNTCKTRPATAEEIALAELMDKLEQPIYDRWGGFDGDFHVDGTLTWDVVARTATFEGSEGEMRYDGFEYEL